MKKVLVALVGALVGSVGFAGAAQAGSLINYSFEEGSSSFVNSGHYRIIGQDHVNGWQTTDTGIEIWNDGFLGVDAVEGDYFAEINANDHGSLFQEVKDIAAGQELGFSFMHRARQGTDVMNLEITDLGLDNVFGTEDDTTLFTKNYSATTEGWVLNTSAGEDAITTLGNDLRFAYSSVSTGSNSISVGNFLDAAQFGLKSDVLGGETQDVPEPGLLLGLLLFGGAGFRKISQRESVS